MKSIPQSVARPLKSSSPAKSPTKIFALLLVLVCAHGAALAQGQKLPSPDKVVADYLKAVGGKKRVAALRDATYEWVVQNADGAESRARVLTKPPAYVRSEVEAGRGETVFAVNPRMAWRLAPDFPVETLTGGEAFNARLRATLGAARLLDFKKLKVLARTVGTEQVGGETAYVLEFSTREGGRTRLWFGAASKLLLKSEDGRGGFHLYSDYRPQNGVLEPHRYAHESGGRTLATYALRGARYNTGLADALFEPPGDSTLDIPALLRDLSKNQDETDRRVNDYTFTQKVTEREVDDKGRVKKEKVSAYEVYPVVDYGMVRKLVSENGAPLSPERAAKEERRVAEELEKAEREAPKNRAKRERERAERREKQKAKAKAGGEEEEDVDVGIATFLRACEFVSPRRERFRDRDVIVFDFRPRPGFKPQSRGESLVSKLSGVIWVDPKERHVMRLEGRLVSGFKVGGGLLASIREGSAFIFEQTRLDDGLWMPRYSQVNASARVMLFAGMTINETHEFSDYKRFSAKSGEDKLDSPKKPEPEAETPPQP